MLGKFGQEKSSDKEVLVNCISLDVEGKEAEEKNENAKPSGVETGDKQTEQSTSRKVVITNERIVEQLRIKILFRCFLDRFLEMLVIIQVLLVAINWVPFRTLIEDNFWPLELIALFLLLVWQLSLLVPSLKRVPGFYLPKFIYLCLLTSIFLIVGIHFPRLFFTPNLSPYFAVLATGTAGATYIFLSILTITKAVNAKSSSLYLCALVVPVYVLVASQTVYSLAFSKTTYNVFMLNVIAGVVTGIYFSLAQVFYNKRYVYSSKFEEILKALGLVAAAPTTSDSNAKIPSTQPFDGEKKNEYVETV